MIEHGFGLPRVNMVYERVEKLYLNSAEGTIGGWCWSNHVQDVVQRTVELSDKYGGDKEKAIVGALLHDLGDVWVNRTDPSFEERTNAEGRKVLAACGFSPEDIEAIFQDVLLPHPCKNGVLPTKMEGKAMATADALGHLVSSFYDNPQIKEIISSSLGINEAGFKNWAYEKIQRDFNNKIFFDEIREQVRPRYEELLRRFAP